MKKKNHIRFLCGLYSGQQEYDINGVHYVVESRFLSWKISAKPSIRDRFERITRSNLVPLPIGPESDNMEAEYVCLAAGKEDHNAAQKE